MTDRLPLYNIIPSGEDNYEKPQEQKPRRELPSYEIEYPEGPKGEIPF